MIKTYIFINFKRQIDIKCQEQEGQEVQQEVQQEEEEEGIQAPVEGVQEQKAHLDLKKSY